MEHPPDTHSARTPVGTTATPGLTLDLATPIPWLRWALVAATIVAGVLLTSCLLCTVCCCRRGRHRKRPRDKEAVVLGTTGLTTTTHLIRVGLKQAADLRPRTPGGTADPYARLSLSPDTGCTHETKVHPGTLCPVFEETCSFHHGTLGTLSLPLGSVDLQHVLELWRPLGPPAAAEPEQTEELCFLLRYVPGSGRLTVVVLEARGLSPALADPYVKVQLLLNQRKWKKRKTSARKGTATPYYNEAFTFLVPFSQIQSVDLVLAVWARGPQLRPQPVARCCWTPSAGQTCWPRPGGQSPSGTACSQPGRWARPGLAVPPASALARLLRAALGLGVPVRAAPGPAVINASPLYHVSFLNSAGMAGSGAPDIVTAPPVDRERVSSRGSARP